MQALAKLAQSQAQLDARRRKQEIARADTRVIGASRTCELALLDGEARGGVAGRAGDEQYVTGLAADRAACALPGGT